MRLSLSARSHCSRRGFTLGTMSAAFSKASLFLRAVFGPPSPRPVLAHAHRWVGSETKCNESPYAGPGPRFTCAARLSVAGA